MLVSSLSHPSWTETLEDFIVDSSISLPEKLLGKPCLSRRNPRRYLEVISLAPSDQLLFLDALNSFPSTSRIPELGKVSPAREFNKVVFPEPFVPRIKLILPSKSALTLSSAIVEPNFFAIFLTDIFMSRHWKLSQNVTLFLQIPSRSPDEVEETLSSLAIRMFVMVRMRSINSSA